MSLLELHDVSKVYQRRKGLFPFRGGDASREYIEALAGISFTVEEGQAVGIVGESGAGKTTLAQMISGLIAPSRGSIVLGGRKLGEFGRLDLSRTLQLIWQDTKGSLDPLMTVGSSIAEPLKVHGMGDYRENAAYAHQLLRYVGLSEDMGGRYAYELSGGELQRVVIARALATRPRILICDEPASALDARLKAQIAALLVRLRAERKLTYLIIAHDLALIGRITDRIIIMYAGMIVEMGPTSEVLAKPLHPYSKLLIGSDPALWLAENQRREKLREEKSPSGDAMPDAARAASGCPFHPACRSATGRCAQIRPMLLGVKGGREVACLFPGGKD